MAELLKKMALAGEGVAWLPRSAIAARARDAASSSPRAAATGAWTLELRVYRDAIAAQSRSSPLCGTGLAGRLATGDA